jgi:SAM-dependent methyltransferase
MNDQDHWERVYSTKSPDAVSWYAPHLNTSLALIDQAAPHLSTAIIDVGGGESTLVDDLIAKGYQDLSVLDLSAHAIAVAKQRLGAHAANVTWYETDITTAVLPPQRFDIWHDRAVFHFLTDPQQRAAYVSQVLRSVKVGGHVILATFGPQGPEKCSGLPVMRYDSEALHAEFGKPFVLMDSITENHQTPAGVTQQFLYCFCRVDSSPSAERASLT